MAAAIAVSAAPAAPPPAGTRGDTRPAAVICRERGWGPGTRLDGATPYETITIEVTAIGVDQILARVVAEDGHPVRNPGERIMVLFHRDWREVVS